MTSTITKCITSTKVSPNSTFVYPSNKHQTLCVKDSKIAIIGDTSGSMGFDQRGIRWTMLDSCFRENITGPFESFNWNHVVRHDAFIRRFGGCTDPNCLIKDPYVNNTLNNMNVFVFQTDGEISESTMSTFSSTFPWSPDLAVLIMVLPDNSMGLKSSSINMSVLAPFLRLNHIVLLLCADSKLRLIASSIPEYQIEDISSYPLISDFPEFKLSDIFTISIDIREKPQMGYIRIGNVFVNLTQLFETTQPDFTFVELDSIFDSLAVIARTQGKIENLRKVIKIFQKHAERKIKFDNNTPINDEVRILRSIADLKRNGIDGEELETARKQLTQIRMQTHLQQNEPKKDSKDRNQLARINAMYERLCDLEKSGMSADIILSSNRINRLKRAECNIEPDYTDAPEFECNICYETGVCNLLVIGKYPILDYLDDNTVTFPFSKRKINFCPIKVCCQCSQIFVNSGIGPYREEICGSIPLLSLRNPGNVEYTSYMLNMIFGAGKKCYHLFKVFYSLLDHMVFMDCHEDIRNLTQRYMNDLLDYTEDHIGMTEDGNVCILKEAIISMFTSKEYRNSLYNHPIMSTFVIVRSAIRLDVDENFATHIMFNRYIKWLMEIYNSTIDNNSNTSVLELELEKNRQKFLKIFFDHPYGIAIANRYVVPDIIEKPHYLNDFFTYFFKHEGELKFLQALMMPIVYHHIQRHGTSQTLWNTLLGNEPLLNDYYYNYVLPSLSQLKELAIKYFIQNTREDRHSAFTPPFYSPWGSSKLRCSCGKEFGTTESNTVSIDLNRAKHFEEVYGSLYPSSTSSHYNGHMIVRKYMISREDLIDRLRKGEKIKEDLELVKTIFFELMHRVSELTCGNIYSENTATEMLEILLSFFDAMRTYPNFNFRTNWDNELLTNFEKNNNNENRYKPIVVPDNIKEYVLKI